MRKYLLKIFEGNHMLSGIERHYYRRHSAISIILDNEDFTFINLDKILLYSCGIFRPEIAFKPIPVTAVYREIKSANDEYASFINTELLDFNVSVHTLPVLQIGKKYTYISEFINMWRPDVLEKALAYA